MKHQPPTPTLARIAERYGRKLADVEDDYGERQHGIVVGRQDAVAVGLALIRAAGRAKEAK